MVARRVTQLVEDKNDQHGRNALLTAYIQYSATLPHPDTSTPCSKYFATVLQALDSVKHC